MANIPEGTVQYKLFPLLNDESDIMQQLLTMKCVFMTALSPHLDDYIWHDEPFNLSLHLKSKTLEGSVNFSDNMEDEWFIVWLLMKLTRDVDHHLVCQIQDQDREFLLIEAADELPYSLQPEDAEDRLFIHNGKLCLLDSDFTSPARQIRSSHSKYEMDLNVQRAINRRILTFDTGVQHLKHSLNCFIHPTAAILFSKDTTLLSAAVTAFLHRDPISLQETRSMKHFPPGERIWRRVTMTKYQYALLSEQSYSPIKRLEWKIPAQNHPQFKGQDIGSKLVTGLELLLQHAKESSLEDTHLKKIERVTKNPKWYHFLANLKQNGYFKEESEGSQRYTQLLKQAKEYFAHDCMDDRSSICQDGSLRDRATTCSNLLETILSSGWEEHVTCNDSLQPDDDDSWLQIDPACLDSFLSSKFKPLDLDDPMAEYPEMLAEDLMEFLSKESDFTGVETGRPLQRELDSDDDSQPDQVDNKDPDYERDMVKIMKEMDEELSESGVRRLAGQKLQTDCGDPSRPDMDSLLASYSAGGSGGPAWTLLHSMATLSPGTVKPPK